MGYFFVYILKSGFCLALFYLFYRLLLSRETFHRFNRIALLALIFFSVAIPFIHITMDMPVIQQQTIELEAYLLTADTTQQVSSFSWLSILLLIYILGVFFFACQITYSAYCIFRVMRKGKRIKTEDNITLLVVPEQTPPFSWMKYVVISRKDREENGEEILAHEKAHIYGKHSCDLLVAHICILFQWFNPAAWLLKQELQNIHEYEADESVIKQGIDANKYQLLLIKKAVGTERFISITNSFNQSKLKNRITMMLKSKSNPWARMKYLYVLPVAVLATAAFARPEVSSELKKLSESVNGVANETDYAGGGIKVYIKTKEKISQPPSDERSKRISIRDLDGKPLSPLIIVDGKEITCELGEIDPSRIESIRVLKDQYATDAYGEKGKNGVMIIKTKLEYSITIP